MKVILRYTVEKTIETEVDDKYRALVNNEDSMLADDLETEVLNFINATEKDEPADVKVCVPIKVYVTTPSTYTPNENKALGLIATFTS